MKLEKFGFVLMCLGCFILFTAAFCLILLEQWIILAKVGLGLLVGTIGGLTVEMLNHHRKRLFKGKTERKERDWL